MGQGEYQKPLAEKIKALQLEQQVILLPAVKRDQVADFLQHVDIAYLGLLQSGTFTSGVSPTKLADYLNAEKPLLYAVGDNNNAVNQSGCGIECRPGDYRDIASAINQLSSLSEDMLKPLGTVGKLWMQENLDLEKLAKQAIEHFYQLRTTSPHMTTFGQ
jgi:Glycosyl transferases group 1